MAKKVFVLIMLSLCAASVTISQEIKVEGRFVEDSMKIGQEVHYVMRVAYPLNREVIFPDSNFTFEPFEYYSKQYFPTRIEGDLAIDSVIFGLSSFEIDQAQYLQVPVFLLSSKDSIRLTPELDTIYLRELIPVLSDTLQLKTNTAFLDVPFIINYPYISIGIAILLVLLFVGYLIFGKSIRKRFKLRRMRKEFEKFQMAFNGKVSEVRNAPSPELTESTVSIWKKYMENLEDRPYTKLTTKELIASGIEDNLKEVLRNIDRNIYGNVNVAEIDKNLEQLEGFTQARYLLKVQEVQHG